MRIRHLKPDFFCDEILDELPAAVRLAFAGLWCYCDDAGRGIDDRWLIKAAIAPRRDEDTPDVVESWLQLLADAGRIQRYEIGGRRYLQVVHWKHQKINRPVPSKYPPPPLSESSVSAHGADTEGSSRAREEVEVVVEVVPSSRAVRRFSPPDPDKPNGFVDFYVLECRARGYDPVRQWRNQIGNQAKRIAAEKSPDLIRSAIRVVADERKQPGVLAHVIADIEAGRSVANGST